jgi:hypothetical protein
MYFTKIIINKINWTIQINSNKFINNSEITFSKKGK